MRMMLAAGRTPSLRAGFDCFHIGSIRDRSRTLIPTALAARPTRSVLPKHPDDDALDGDVVLVHVDRKHRLVRRLQPDATVALAIDFLHGGGVVVDERDD